MKPCHIKMSEWNEAMARARGEIDIHLAEFAAAFTPSPPPYALVAGTPQSTESIALTSTGSQTRYGR
jgi:hypothetical protein